MSSSGLFRTAILATLVATAPGLHAEAAVFAARAREVTDYIGKNFHNSKSDLYAGELGKGEPDFMWGNGVMFSALAGAARHDKRAESAMRKFFTAMDTYWDTGVKIPGYEPSRTSGGGHDKYYDDNAWMVLTFLEAYEMTGENRYLKRSGEVLDFVLSGWDEQAGGGIWWHEGHKDGTKNTCVNAPAAVGCLELAKFRDPKEAAELVAMAEKIVDWTTRNLQAKNGLYADSLNVTTGRKNPDQLTYNAALMLRAYLGLHAWTGKPEYLTEAERIGKAADSLLDRKTGAYRDPLKWAHLMVEADLELYRKTNSDYLLKRATANAETHYTNWKTSPPTDLITQASLARELWLMADLETQAGRDFWKKADSIRK